MQSVVYIYGDSIMRGTVIDEQQRYHSTISGFLERLANQFSIRFVNRSHFGITVEKGKQILQKDINKGLACDFALLEFGGNDCSYAWDEVGKTPTADHRPATEPDVFARELQAMAQMLQNENIEPVLMTLPPVDAQKHLDFIGQPPNNKKGILSWLGDAQMIYRFHELYSTAIRHVAAATNSLLVDVRAAFLDKHNINELVGPDGVHPSAQGYALICEEFTKYIARRRGKNELTLKNA
ncbi:SGNH/GDSL hydrolase family protein [Clostridia bacterium OttesenSCG-928-O13]|nr:SGNH/GDSL hydrolase family protein [Clostridia bacterium OttesenSCG-928-O13]